MTSWKVRQVTVGSDDQLFHSHSYYDLPVFDADSRLLAGHQVSFSGRHPEPDDAIQIGYCDLEDATWHTVGSSTAWSWQQGAMEQWLPDRRAIIWNDREDRGFVARVFDLDSGVTETLPLPIYAVDPSGRYGLSVNMARLDRVRPGYGYTGGTGDLFPKRHPSADGVWKLDLATGERQLLLSVDRAMRFLLSRLHGVKRLKQVLRRYVYWFNHVKIAPDGRRFTVKLRFRSKDLSKNWNDQMGVSLTCGTNGTDLRLLAWGTSHVIWLDQRQLYFWRGDGLYLFEDEGPEGRLVERMAPHLVQANVHIRHFPGSRRSFVLDTPYQESIGVLLYDADTGAHEEIARFDNHRPKRGPFRCDLHPCPSPDGRRVAVTSLADGGRQIYVLEATP